MRSYLFICPDPECSGHSVIRASIKDQLIHPVCHCGQTMRRDYRRENVSVDGAVSQIRLGQYADTNRDVFLPTREDFERSSVLEAAASGRSVESVANERIKQWNEEHEGPKGSDKYRPR